jgi:hypothetical protein
VAEGPSPSLLLANRPVDGSGGSPTLQPAASPKGLPAGPWPGSGARCTLKEGGVLGAEAATRAPPGAPCIIAPPPPICGAIHWYQVLVKLQLLQLSIITAFKSTSQPNFAP